MQSLRREALTIAKLIDPQSQLYACGAVGAGLCTAVNRHTPPLALADGRLKEDGWRCPRVQSTKHHAALQLSAGTAGIYRQLCSTSHLFSASGPSKEKIKPSNTSDVYTLSNAISFSRLLSAPGIAWLIAAEHWEASLVAISLAGAFCWSPEYNLDR